MPSRPMFTTPARSQTRAAEPGQRDRQGERQHGLRGAGVGQDVLAGDEPGDGQRDQAERGDEADAAPEGPAPARVPSPPGRGAATWVLTPPPPPSGRPAGGVADRAPPTLRSSARSSMRRATSLTMTTDRTITPWVMTTTDGGMSTRCSEGPPGRGRRTAVRDGDPAGRVAAEQGDGDAGEAEAGHEVDAVAWSSPSTCGIPTSPASAPDSSMACIVIRPAGMPLAAAAVRCAPTHAARTRSGSGS